MREPDPTEDTVDPWDQPWRRPETPPQVDRLVAPATVTSPGPGRKPSEATAAPAGRTSTIGEGGEGEPPFYWWSDLRANPEMLRAPKMLIPRLVWEGRSTLLAAKEKCGKSTILSQALVAGLKYEPFFGQDAHAPTALWLAIDEPTNDFVRRTESFAACDLPLAVVDYQPDLATLEAIVDDVRPSVVVVDCLSSFAMGHVKSFKDPEQWRFFLGTQVFPIFRRVNAASVFVHHTVRQGDRYADSREIGAAVDFIIEVERVPAAPTLRRIKGTGRGYPAEWSTYEVDYTRGRYELADGPVALETRILRAIEADPGIGKRKLRDQVQGRNDEIDEAVAGLIRAGLVRDQGTPTARQYYATPPGVPQGVKS